VSLTYLRTLEDGTPAAGKFEGLAEPWRNHKLLDPCCGSGHFLVGRLPVAGAHAHGGQKA
jgi:23S rRNA G2445 N2-methylase RlmL